MEQEKEPERAHTTTYGYAPVGTQVYVEEKTPRVILYDQHGVALTEAVQPIGFKP